MDEIEKAQDKIRAAIKAGRMSKRALARAAGIQSGALTGMEGPNWNPKARTLRALLAVIRKRPLGNGASQSSVAA